MHLEGYIRRVMSGAETGPAAGGLRMGMAALEPIYAGVMRARNRRYDLHPRRIHRLPAPTISVGNLTTGGTGKTPVIRWLAEQLRDAGQRAAILSRGYKSAAGAVGDEQAMLEALLNAPRRQRVLIRSSPDRLAAAADALREQPDIDVFLLDDAFQHRRVARDLDLVLLHAAEPFGYGRVLPRGMLREPLAGIGRADGMILTHALSVDEAERQWVVKAVRKWNQTAPIYRCIHATAGLRTAGAAPGEAPDRSERDLRDQRAFAFCGIGNPDALQREVRRLAGDYAGHRWFADHHAYASHDLDAVRRAARAAGATVLITTEKDWAKLARLPAADADDPPIWRLDVVAKFLDNDGDQLMARVRAAVDAAARER